jgi:hypothetical protein
MPVLSFAVTNMISLTSGFSFMIAIIIILILVSIQFTLNLILRELRSIRMRLGGMSDTEYSEKKQKK